MRLTRLVKAARIKNTPKQTNGNFVNRLIVLLSAFIFLSACQMTSILPSQASKTETDCIVGNDWYVVGYNAYLEHSRLLCENEKLLSKGLPIKPVNFNWPSPPQGKSWSKKLAFEQFQQQNITVKQLGYLYAALEYVYRNRVRDAKHRLENSLISKPVYQLIVKEAKASWEG